jgi:hypothetical protein
LDDLGLGIQGSSKLSAASRVELTSKLMPPLLTGALPIERTGALLWLLDEFHIGYTLSTDSPALQKTSLSLPKGSGSE